MNTQVRKDVAGTHKSGKTSGEHTGPERCHVNTQVQKDTHMNTQVRRDVARFCVEVLYALYINFHSFIHS